MTLNLSSESFQNYVKVKTRYYFSSILLEKLPSIFKHVLTFDFDSR